MTKQYRTRDGEYTAEILKTDIKTTGGGIADNPVLALLTNIRTGYQTTLYYSMELRANLYSDSNHIHDLIEVGSYDHIKKGDLVLVWDENAQHGTLPSKYVGVFVEATIEDKVCAYFLGDPDDQEIWGNCEKIASLEQLRNV